MQKCDILKMQTIQAFQLNSVLCYCPQKLCVLYRTMYLTAQPFRCDVWKEVAEPVGGLLPAPTSLVRTFLNWLQSSV